MDSLKLRAMDDVERVRAELKGAERTAEPIVQVRCFDRTDAEKIHEQLTEEERRFVSFTWLVR